MMSTSFQDKLADPTKSIITDFSVPSRAVLVAFGGLRGELDIPPFEFFRLTVQVPVKKIFVRDLGQAWYHRGVPGIARDVDELAVYLKSAVQQADVQRVVTVGTSAGGYAALLLGSLMEVDDVHAFSAQTFLGRWNRLRHRDGRWKRQVRAVHGSRTVIRRYLDLKRVFASRRVGTCFHLHFCDNHRLDRIHAQRLGGLPGVKLLPYPEGGHRLVKFLRDQDRLQQLLLRAVGE